MEVAICGDCKDRAERSRKLRQPRKAGKRPLFGASRSIDRHRWQRAAVVGIGAFGMNIDRQNMYSRDIAFFPSLAYGPGRYDHVYEEGSVDYPIGYARWAENRNAAAVLRLIAEGSLDVGPLAPVRIPVERAPDAYELLRSPERPPTVLLTYENA